MYKKLKNMKKNYNKKIIKKMRENYQQNNEKDNSYIKIIINQSQLFQKDKITIPYNLYLQFDDFPEKKIKSINNILQKFEPPSNEYVFEINPKENKLNDDLLEHILIINAYTTTIFFIQKKLASIKIPIFLNKSISKQWYILKDNNDEACIKLLIEIQINISNNLYNKGNQYIFFKNNDFMNNSINEIAVRKKNESTIINNNKLNVTIKNNINHNNNNSNCYTHLSTNFHSIYSNSLLKMNSHSTNNSNIILANNKSTPLIFNNNNCNNNYSNLSYILVDKEKDKNSESNTIYNNDNFFCELEIPLEDKNNNISLEEQLNTIKKMINYKEKKIEEKENSIDMKKNELVNLEKKFYIRNKKYEKDLSDFNHNIRKLEKDKQQYENKNFDLNDTLLNEKFKKYKNILIDEINTYEKDILSNINYITLNNYNNDNLLLDSKMNNLLDKKCNQKGEYNEDKENININYKIKNKLYMDLGKYISNTINKKEKKNAFGNNSNSNIINKSKAQNISSDLSITNRNKRYMKNHYLMKKNTTIKHSFKSKNINSIMNNSTNSKNGKLKNFMNKQEIKSEKINNYSSNKIRLKKNNILNNHKIKLTHKSNTKNKLNNLSCLNKNSIFNSSLSKKIINSNNILNLHKDYSLATLGCTKSDNLSTDYYSNTYKSNKKVKKYPIKLKYLNVANYDNNNIYSTESIFSANYEKNKNFNSFKKGENKNNSINCYNSNNNFNNLYTTTIKNDKKRKIYGDNILNKRKNNKLKSISVDKENNYSQNIEINVNNKQKNFKNIKKKDIDVIKSVAKCTSKLKIILDKSNK